MRQPDHWYARNFAKDDPATREHVRQTLIPRWRKEIEKNQKAVNHLCKIGRDEDDPILALVTDEIETIRENIEIAEARLSDWEHSNARDPLADCGNQSAAFDLGAHLTRQAEWSERTFGPGARTEGVIDHIRKELREIEVAPGDLSEWIAVVLLALDGAWRSGASPDEIVSALAAKQARNENREWPDWRQADTSRAIEHVCHE